MIHIQDFDPQASQAVCDFLGENRVAELAPEGADAIDLAIAEQLAEMAGGIPPEVLLHLVKPHVAEEDSPTLGNVFYTHLCAVRDKLIARKAMVAEASASASKLVAAGVGIARDDVLAKITELGGHSLAYLPLGKLQAFSEWVTKANHQPPVENATARDSDDLDMAAEPKEPADLVPDLDMAGQFIEALTGARDTEITVQTFSDKKSKGERDPLAKIMHGTLAKLAPKLTELNRKGAGIFICVNETDLKGRTAENIIAVRSVWGDFDKPFDGAGALALALAAAEKLAPSIEVESSPGKRHEYWLTDGITADGFRPLIDRLTVSIHSDPGARTIERVLRIPGFFHRKGDPVMVKLIAAHPERRYTGEQIASAFGLDTLQADDAKPQERAAFDPLAYVLGEQKIADLRAALQHLDPNDRDTWFAVCAALCRSGEAGFELFHEWSKTAATDGEHGYQGKDDCRAKFSETTPSAKSAPEAIFTRAQAAGWINKPTEAATPSVNEIIAQLRALPTEEEVIAKWIELTLPLAKSDADKVIAEIGRWYPDRKAIPLRADLRDARQKAEIEKNRARARKVAGELPLIHVRLDETTRMAEHVERLLLEQQQPGSYAMFGGQLSRVAIDKVPFTHLIGDEDGEPPAVALIEPLDEPALIAKIENVCKFGTVDDEGKMTLQPVPKIVMQHLRSTMRENGERQVPRLSGVLTHPIVQPNDEILTDNGLHRNGLFLIGVEGINCQPFDRFEAVEALHRLRTGELLLGFEFASDLDREVAIASLFTATQRRILDVAPGVLVTADTQASGKTTLARRLHVILTGRDMPVVTVPGTEEEMAKKLAAMLRLNPEMICFDNIADAMTFRSAELSAAVTNPEYRTRLLGASEEIVAPTNVFFTLTGNNIALGTDEITRFMVTRLSPASMRPETRKFEKPDVVAHGRAIRASVLRDVIGIVAGYLASGDTVTTEEGSRFPLWDKMVRQAIIWAEGMDVAEVFKLNTDENESRGGTASVFNLLHQMFGEERFTVSQITDLCKTGPVANFDAAIREKLTPAEIQLWRRGMCEALDQLRCADPGSTKSVGHTLKALTHKRAVVADVGVMKMIAKRDNTMRFYKLCPGSSAAAE